MGGRGTFAFPGNHQPDYQYKTVATHHGIPILTGIGTKGKHDLPIESHSSKAYAKINRDGSIRTIRVYNDDHTVKTDLDYSRHQGKLTMHAHDFEVTRHKDYETFVRSAKPRDLTKEEMAKYGKYLGKKIHGKK